MKFYQHSGVYDIAGDFDTDNLAATSHLRDAMRTAGLERTVQEALPDFIPGDDIALHSGWVSHPGHYAAWCYRLAGQLNLRGSGTSPGFWRLVLELPDVRSGMSGIDMQARAEEGFKACMRSCCNPPFRPLYAHDEFLTANGLWQGSGIEPGDLEEPPEPGLFEKGLSALEGYPQK